MSNQSLSSTAPYYFYTNGKIPLEAFTTFGINHKPNSKDPIGYFGTGLKYAVAIILRHGGEFRVTIDGVEHEFYCKDADFRGKNFNQVRMRKRNSALANWRSTAMPFTTELGKNWGLWQAFRELESNTRDENGSSSEDKLYGHSGTCIEIRCEGFADESGKLNKIFLDSPGKILHDGPRVTISEGASDCLYFRGVRVHDLRYKSRFTYNFKSGYVTLSEDRTAMNAYVMYWYIAQIWMNDVQDRGAIYKALHQAIGNDDSFFEGHDLSFDGEAEASTVFKGVAKMLNLKGFAPTGIRSYYATYSSVASTRYKMNSEIEISLFLRQWKDLCELLERPELNGDGLSLAKTIMDQVTDKAPMELWEKDAAMKASVFPDSSDEVPF